MLLMDTQHRYGAFNILSYSEVNENWINVVCYVVCGLGTEIMYIYE